MKQILIITIFILFITGCNKESESMLSCTLTQNTSDNITTQSVVSTFLEGNVSKIDISIETKLNDKYLEHIDLFVNQVEEEFVNYKNKPGIVMNTEKKDKSILFKMNIDIESLDDESKKILEIIDVNSTYDGTKKSLESIGYLCK